MTHREPQAFRSWFPGTETWPDADVREYAEWLRLREAAAARRQKIAIMKFLRNMAAEELLTRHDSREVS